MDARFTILFSQLHQLAVSSLSCHMGFPFMALLEQSSVVGIALFTAISFPPTTTSHPSGYPDSCTV